MSKHPYSSPNEHSTPPKASFWQVCKSVFAALLGVQTEEARARDFSQTNPLPYLVVGALAIIGFVVLMLFIVRTVIQGAS